MVNINKNGKISYVSIGNIYGPKTVVFLHGIMGNKKNLLFFAKKFVEQNESVGAIIFDLPGHAQSRGWVFKPDIYSCAELIAEAIRALNIDPYAFIGHSFGAKIAILSALQFTNVKQVFLLDASPGAKVLLSKQEKSLHLSTLDLIDILAKLPWPLADRALLVKMLIEQGVSKPIAMWMTTNLIEVPTGLVLSFDLEIIKKLLLSFFVSDLWTAVKDLSSHAFVHLVAAEHGGRLFAKDEKKLHKMLLKRGFFHVVKDAGHFLHSDNLAGLLLILNPYF